MSRARFLAEAEAEFLQEVAYYAERQLNGAVRFRKAVEAATARALAFPKSGPPYLVKTRRVFVRGYPFFLISRVAPTGLLGVTCPLTPQRTARLAANVRRFHMQRSLFALAVFTAVLLVGRTEAQSPQGDATAFHSKVVSLYSFEPHKLTSQQIEAKSKVLDDFWSEIKADPKRYLPLLRNELRDERNSAFFSYDGSKLLLAISEDRNDRGVALEAIPRADLQGVQHTDYLRTVHWFARSGFHTTKAALRILDYPDFKAFIVQHALTLGQNYSLIYMLFPMRDSDFVPALIDRLNTETSVVSQKSILLALWYSMTAEAKAAAARFLSDTSKSEEARNYAKELAQRKASITSALTISTARQLKEERRKVMYRLSDEALLEFDSLTLKLLAKH